MTGNRTTREKLGAVFFAFVMVTSMVTIGGAAFAGSAAADASTWSAIASDDIPAENSSFNQTLTVELGLDANDNETVVLDTGGMPDGVTFVSSSNGTNITSQNDDFNVTEKDLNAGDGEISANVTNENSSSSVTANVTFTLHVGSTGAQPQSVSLTASAQDAGSDTQFSFDIVDAGGTGPSFNESTEYTSSDTLINVSVTDDVAVAEDTISVNATNTNTSTTYTLVENGNVQMGETRSSANFTDENNNKTEYVNLTTSLPAGEYTIGASASDTADNSNSTTGLGDGFDVDLGVSLDPDTVVANQETTVDVTLSNAPSGDVNYALLDDGTNLRTTGSTSGDTFSVTDTFDTGNNFTVAVSPDIDAVDLTYSNNDGASNVSVEDRNLVENYNVDPANPQYNGSATVSGTLVNSSTGDPVTSTTVQLNDTETRTLLDVDTTGGQDGTFELSTDRFPDATTYEVVDTSDGSTVETVDVGAADATVSLETEGNNQGGFDENYTVTAQSDTGAELSNFTTAGTPGNYLNVTGPFDGEVTGDNLQTGNLLNSNYNNSEGITNYSSR